MDCSPFLVHLSWEFLAGDAEVKIRSLDSPVREKPTREDEATAPAALFRPGGRDPPGNPGRLHLDFDRPSCSSSSGSESADAWVLTSHMTAS